MAPPVPFGRDGLDCRPGVGLEKMWHGPRVRAANQPGSLANYILATTRMVGGGGETMRPGRGGGEEVGRLGGWEGRWECAQSDVVHVS